MQRTAYDRFTVQHTHRLFKCNALYAITPVKYKQHTDIRGEQSVIFLPPLSGFRCCISRIIAVHDIQKQAIRFPRQKEHAINALPGPLHDYSILARRQIFGKTFRMCPDVLPVSQSIAPVNLRKKIHGKVFQSTASGYLRQERSIVLAHYILIIDIHIFQKELRHGKADCLFIRIDVQMRKLIIHHADTRIRTQLFALHILIIFSINTDRIA